VVLIPILAGIFWIGLYPKPILRRMEPAAQHLIDTVKPATTQPAALR
jgi:NADH:ubiquinone oxidoreductase subunit 4 (subunit M)